MRHVQNLEQQVWPQLQAWARELGFSQIGVSDVDLSSAEAGFLAWLEAGFAGQMHYMAEHGLKRLRPAELLPGTVRVITARMDYLPEGEGDWREIEWSGLRRPQQAMVSTYARGRDYHKVLRARLATLATRLQALIGPFGHRAFTDSAPVAEVELAQRSGLGWRGKHTLLLHRQAGSMFFLGELFVDLPLPVTDAASDHCGQCSACIEACPTGAIVAPYRLDARRCISYLTIEEPGPIPEALRPLVGNRIYGCDDCQLICPWNKYARTATLPDFSVRPQWQEPDLLALWGWTEPEFLRLTEGSAIRRIGWQRWRRNLAVALGNALRDRAEGECAPQDPAQATGGEPAEAVEARWRTQARQALQDALPHATPLVAEHVQWALAQGRAPGAVQAAPP